MYNVILKRDMSRPSLGDDEEHRKNIHTGNVCMIASYPFLLSVGSTHFMATRKWTPPECMNIPVSKDHLQVWYSDSDVIMITRTSPGSLKRVYADAIALFCCED
jgi:hypothetical protein